MTERKGFPRWLVFVLAFVATGVIYSAWERHQREQAVRRSSAGTIEAAFARGALNAAVATLCEGGDAALCELAEPLEAADPERCEERTAAVGAVRAQFAAFAPQATQKQVRAIEQAAARLDRVPGCPKPPERPQRKRR